MEKTNKKTIISIICSIIIFSLCIILVNPTYAENQTTNKNENTTNTVNTANTNNSANTTKNTSSSNTKATNTATQKSTNEVKTTQKSSNANLQNLGIRPHDFSGFKSGTTSYNVTVPSDTDTIEIYAKAQDSNATISGTGSKKLEDGKNTFSIVVTAENGATKTYTINVTKTSGQEENSENIQSKYTGDGLASLNVENLELSPSFDTTVYEYSAKYIGEATKLNIEANPTDPYYVVEITGNEDLKEGENLINILVSDPDGNNVANYQITVNKSLVDEEAIAKEKQKEENKKKAIIGVIIAVVIVAIIIFLIIRHKRNKDLAEEFSVPPYSNLNDDRKNHNQLEDYDENMNYIENEDNDGIELTKEQARKEFLNGYNNNNAEEMNGKEENEVGGTGCTIRKT